MRLEVQLQVGIMWEDRRLRDITEADVRQIVDSGLEEHLQLEYKSALYDSNHQGSKESLLDICMFANAGGGILLIGISERRDANGQPTGMPDPNAALGVDLANPELTLQSYDARVVANIQERLTLESYAIPVANNRYVVAMRVPNSTSKPHRVHHQGHVYFPSRRERQRYEMDVREIKEMVMRTASRLEEAEDKLSGSLAAAVPTVFQGDQCDLFIGSIPVFWQNFMVDVRNSGIIQTVSQFDLGYGNFLQPTYNFNGLQRKILGNEDSLVRVHRDGMIVVNKRLHIVNDAQTLYLRPAEIDIILRAFVGHAANVYTAASINGPFLLTMLLHAAGALTGRFPMPGYPGAERSGATIFRGSYTFPVLQADNFLDVDSVIRPLCDQAHQMFGGASSPNFNADGVWSR
jgi:hypothetical protein